MLSASERKVIEKKTKNQMMKDINFRYIGNNYKRKVTMTLLMKTKTKMDAKH